CVPACRKWIAKTRSFKWGTSPTQWQPPCPGTAPKPIATPRCWTRDRRAACCLPSWSPNASAARHSTSTPRPTSKRCSPNPDCVGRHRKPSNTPRARRRTERRSFLRQRQRRTLHVTNLWPRLRQRKLVQWAVAYVAFAFALIQGVDVVAQQFGWPEGVRRGIALVLGFFVMLVLAWYHGERGAQRVTGTELLIIALLLAVGGGVLWRYARTPVVSAADSSTSVVTASGMAPVSQAVGTTPASMAASTAATQSIPAKSIAVLPFENLSSDKDNAYFSDGMQDLILTKLADIGQLKVISRTSTMKYASHPEDLKTIAQQLGV